MTGEEHFPGWPAGTTITHTIEEHRALLAEIDQLRAVNAELLQVLHALRIAVEGYEGDPELDDVKVLADAVLAKAASAEIAAAEGQR
jgi:hypothetical protein